MIRSRAKSAGNGDRNGEPTLLSKSLPGTIDTLCLAYHNNIVEYFNNM